MLSLPRPLSALARLCPRESPRYALTALKIAAYDGGAFRVDATDGRYLGIVRGNSEAVAHDCLNEVPDEATEALIPADEWAKAFRLIPKPRKNAASALSSVGLKISKDGFTFGAAGATLAGKQTDGRFPVTNEVLPKARCMFSTHVDARRLAELLTVAAEFADVNGCVTLHFYHPAKPMGVSARNSEGLFFDGLLMPLS